VAAIVLGLIGSGGARGQVNPLQIIALAQGYSNQNTVNLHINGPTDALQTELVFQPGAETGGVAEVYATFLSSAGSQPLIPAANPGGVCRPEHREDN
jgi:hypothetical protein